VNGAVLWEGETRLPGQTGRVAAIVTGMTSRSPSKNRKTGPMAQVWYIPIDEPGTLFQAVATGRDRAVCGDCKHRPSEGGACYVDLFRGPQRIWYTYKRGGYPRPGLPVIREALRGRAVRLGSYGEPPSIPLHVYHELLPDLGSWQGYTHAWKRLDAADWGFLMASTDTRWETIHARALGWRTFRVRAADEDLLEGERVCPAAAEAGHKLTCDRCRQCDGVDKGAGRPSRVIVAHGFRAGRFVSAVRQLRLFAGI
jgi:hypothetical protein